MTDSERELKCRRQVACIQQWGKGAWLTRMVAGTEPSIAKMHFIGSFSKISLLIGSGHLVHNTPAFGAYTTDHFRRPEVAAARVPLSTQECAVVDLHFRQIFDSDAVKRTE